MKKCCHFNFTSLSEHLNNNERKKRSVIKNGSRKTIKLKHHILCVVIFHKPILNASIYTNSNTIICISQSVISTFLLCFCLFVHSFVKCLFLCNVFFTVGNWASKLRQQDRWRGWRMRLWHKWGMRKRSMLR